jgi:predicted phosphodiesterase
MSMSRDGTRPLAGQMGDSCYDIGVTPDRLLFLGDIHGDIDALFNANDLAAQQDAIALIQVGDFGFTLQDLTEAAKRRRRSFDVPTYLIDGNHEHFPEVAQWSRQPGLVPLIENVFYVPRGTLVTINRLNIAFIGGACSVDKDIRLRQGMAWYPEEEVTDADIARLDNVSAVDLLVTHVPPQSIIEKHFSRDALVYMFGLQRSWTDPSALRIETLWQRLGKPPLICGHMHRSVIDGDVRILDINQVLTLPAAAPGRADD